MRRLPSDPAIRPHRHGEDQVADVVGGDLVNNAVVSVAHIPQIAPGDLAA